MYGCSGNNHNHFQSFGKGELFLDSVKPGNQDWDSHPRNTSNGVLGQDNRAVARLK